MEQLQKLQDLITEHKIPIGQWSKAIIEWLTANFEWLFDAISSVLKTLIDGSSDLLLLVPPLVLLVIIAALAHLIQRNWKITLFVAVGLLFILNLGLWGAMVETLVLVVYATLVSLAIGVPIGILAARRPAVWHAIAPVLDMMQTLPTFVYLVPMLALFGLGTVPGMFATVIFAVAAPIRLTYLGISQVVWLDKGILGDDTHGHVDDITRFVGPRTVVTVVEPNRKDKNHAILAENVKRLKAARDQDGKALDIVELPMPKPVLFEDTRLPASYANFLIAIN
jgi:hypothetical protein